VPYMLVVGHQEVSDAAVSVRRHREGDIGRETVPEVVARLRLAIDTRAAPG
jgi:threonyl-tRNA synthetase